MTWPQNRQIITQIKTSITAHIRPCSMIFHEQPTDEWSPFDFMLLEAYQMLQDETCPKCGHPIWLCRSSSQNVQFKVGTEVCYAERALKEAEDQRLPRGDRAASKDKKEWGVFHYTSPFVPENVEGEFPTRNDFYKELADKTGN